MGNCSSSTTVEKSDLSLSRRGIGSLGRTPLIGLSLRTSPDPMQPGVLVVRADADEPGDLAGIRLGDIIRKISGSRVATTHDFMKWSAKAQSGDRHNFEVLRDGRRFAVPVIVGSSEDYSVQREQAVREMKDALRALEVAKTHIQELDGGLLIDDVRDGSAGACAGLQKGDRVQKVDGVAVRNASEYKSVMHTVPIGVPAPFQICRDGRVLIIPVWNKITTLGPLLAIGAHGRAWETGLTVHADTDNDHPNHAHDPDHIYPSPGVRVARVLDNLPAALAGVREGDRLTSVSGTPLRSQFDYDTRLASAHAGERLTFGVLRDGRPLAVTLILGGKGDFAADPENASLAVKAAHATLHALRSRIRDLNPEFGVTVVGVRGPYAIAGLKKGDLVQSVDGLLVANRVMFLAVVRALPHDVEEPVPFQIYRHGRARIIPVRLGSAPNATVPGSESSEQHAYVSGDNPEGPGSDYDSALITTEPGAPTDVGVGVDGMPPAEATPTRRSTVPEEAKQQQPQQPTSWEDVTHALDGATPAHVQAFLGRVLDSLPRESQKLSYKMLTLWFEQSKIPLDTVLEAWDVSAHAQDNDHRNGETGEVVTG